MRTQTLTGAMVVLAIAIRIAAILLLQSHEVPRSTFEHGEIAANLLKGRGFSIRFLGVDGPTSQQAPLYPFVVAGAYWLGGIETPHALLILQCGQALLAGLLVWAVIQLGREIVPNHPRAWLLAGLITGVHPTLVYAVTHVQVAGLAATLVVLSFLFAHRLARMNRWSDLIANGIVTGLLILTDPILGLIVPAVALVLAQRLGVWVAARRLGTISLVITLMITPWVLRNASVHGEFVPIKSTFGYAFWQGNCALSQGTDKVVRESVEEVLEAPTEGLRGLNRQLWEARHEAGYIDDIALSHKDYQELSTHSEPSRSRLLFHRALNDLKADPARYPTLCLRRLRAFLLWDQTNPKTRNLIYRTGHLCLTVTALLAWFTIGSDLRRQLASTCYFVVGLTCFHSLTIVSARFHIPIEPILGLWAGIGLDRVWLEIGSRLRPSENQRRTISSYASGSNLGFR